MSYIYINSTDLYKALELLGITGDPREITRIEIDPHNVKVTRHQLRDGKPWLDDGRIVLTAEDIRIVYVDPSPPPAITIPPADRKEK